jgi:hypothetical protein
MARIMTEETSLTRRRRSLQKENVLLKRLHLDRIAAGGVLVAVAGGVRLAMTGRSDLLIAGVLLAYIAFSYLIKIRQNREEEQTLEAGARGESQTARQLADSLDNTNYLFNDIILRNGFQRAQIDHLVVGPRGVFVVETKNWRGRIEGHGNDLFWQQFKRPGEAPIRIKSPVVQVRRQSALVGQVLRSAGHSPDVVVPIVAFASTRTELSVDSPEIPVVHVVDVGRLISGHTPGQVQEEKQVDAIVNLIGKRL